MNFIDPQNLQKEDWTSFAQPRAAIPTIGGGGGIASAASLPSSVPTTQQATTAMPSVSASRGNDVADRVTAITSQDSAFMRAARSRGLASANRRGLVNSSIATGAAEAAALDAAAPIAAQDSQQQYGYDVNTANLAAAERERQAAFYAQMAGNYQNAVATTSQNPELPASARAAYDRSFLDSFNGGLGFMQNLYGVSYGQPAARAPATGIGGGAPWIM